MAQTLIEQKLHGHNLEASNRAAAPNAAAAPAATAGAPTAVHPPTDAAPAGAAATALATTAVTDTAAGLINVPIDADANDAAKGTIVPPGTVIGFTTNSGSITTTVLQGVLIRYRSV